jgi:carbonic anhydrase/acetyltransferase-like protein (isoleucine patch superfamily)
MLEKLKENFNKQTHTVLHPYVVGLNALEIPTFHGILLYGHDNIRFEGNVQIAEGAVVQRATSVMAAPGRKVTIGAHAPVMDYVDLHATKYDISIGERVTIAHGSQLVAEKEDIVFADDSFGNIIIRVDGGTIQERGYIGPNTTLTSGEVIPTGAVFFGNPKFQASIRTDQDGKIVEGVQHIMRMNIVDTSQSLVDSGGKPLTARAVSPKFNTLSPFSN